MAASIQTGDYTFRFHDSCNCFCMRGPSDDTLVYVNEDGDLERLSVKKSRANSAIIKSKNNLERKLSELAVQYKKTEEQLIEAIKLESGVDVEKQMAMTYGDFKKINATMTKTLSSSA